VTTRVPIKHLFAVSRNMVLPNDYGNEPLFHYSLPAWHEHGDGIIENATDLASGKLLLKGGEVLVSKLNPEKSAVLLADEHEIPTVCSPEFIALVPKKIDRKFAYYFMLSGPLRHQLNASVESVTNSHKRARVDRFLASCVDLPDLPTQRAIADFLDRETARIDLLIEKKQRLVALLGEKLDRTVRAYLAGEADYPNEDQRCATGIGYLPTAPKHWSVEKVGWRYQIQLGKMLDGAKQTGENLRRYLRVADVQWGKINTDDLPEMDFSPNDRKRFRLQYGDLLVNEGGSYVGRSAVWRSDESEVFYQKALHRVRPRSAKRDSAEFLYYLMWFATKNGVFIAGGNQTTIDHLTAEAFARYRFAFPNLDEQKRISERLKFEEAQNDEVSSKVNASIERLKEYRSALITAAVTGQIDVSTYAKSGATDRRLDAIQEEMGA
jgi:type I restriction enzyme S subunit